MWVVVGWFECCMVVYIMTWMRIVEGVVVLVWHLLCFISIFFRFVLQINGHALALHFGCSVGSCEHVRELWLV